MKKLRKFKCKSGVVFERFANDNQQNLKCKCGEMALKTISAAKFFGNGAGGRSPSAS